MSHVVVASATGSVGTADELLRRVVAEVVGVPAVRITTGRHCPHCGSDAHGRPRVAVPTQSVEVSLARAAGLVVVAVSTAGPVGIDVEGRTAADWDGFDGVALHAAEVASSAADRTRTWVRKESVLKAAGLGLRVDPRRLLLSGPEELPQVINWEGSDGERGSAREDVWMWDLEFGSDHVGCVSVLAATEPGLSLRPAAPGLPSPTARPGRSHPGRRH